MRLPSGHPWWQNGTPHSMQRAPCCFSSTSGSVLTNSRWSPTRSRGSRSGVSARAIFLKAPSSPTRNPNGRQPGCEATWLRDLGRVSRGRLLGLPGVKAVAAGRDRGKLLERAAVVVWHHLHERRPLGEYPRSDGRARALEMLRDERTHGLEVLFLERLEPDELRVAALPERSVLVEDVRDAAAHAGREVAARAAEHDDHAARHVLAAVVADALDDRPCARVPHCEALADEPAEERAPRGRAVQDRVACDQ